MARLSQLIGAGLLALFGASAHAAYTSGRPPPGWQTMQSSPTGYGYAKAATEMWIDGKLVNSTLITTPAASKNLPVLQRIDPVAARRTAVSLLFTHPAMRSAAAVFSWLQIAKVVWDESSQQWKREVGSDGQGGVSTSDGFEYSHDNVAWFSSGSQACEAWAAVPGRLAGDVKLSGTRFYLDRYNTPYCAVTFVRLDDYNGMKAGETSTSHFSIYRRQGACPAGESVIPPNSTVPRSRTMRPWPAAVSG
jgi:hypothetical protein